MAVARSCEHGKRILREIAMGRPQRYAAGRTQSGAYATRVAAGVSGARPKR